MGIMLYNPTNERFEMQFGGVSMTMKPNAKLEVEDACGNHLLNAFGQRGLCKLFYDCDEKKIKEDGKKRNFEFKKKQVIEYNQRNENRKQMGLPYLPATDKVKEYAVDLQLELLEPYSVRDEERGAIAESRDREKALQSQIVDLQIAMANLIEELKVDKKEVPKKDA